MKSILISILFIGFGYLVHAQEYKYTTDLNIKYYDDSTNESDQYISKQCVLDIYYPTDRNGFSTVIWFHGGGLTGGDKFIPGGLKEKGICIVAVKYRLYPKVKCPAYLEDAAAATAWVFNNINSLGGDSTLIFVSGISAGGYLTSMIGLDKKWLQPHNIDANRIAGLIPFSGHTITHLTVRKEKGIESMQPIVDEFAPLYHVRSDAPPLLLITGDREMEMLGRYEENAYMMRMMKINGHKETRLYELDGYGHNMVEPAIPLLLNEVNRIVNLRNGKSN